MSDKKESKDSQEKTGKGGNKLLLAVIGLLVLLLAGGGFVAYKMLSHKNEAAAGKEGGHDSKEEKSSKKKKKDKDEHPPIYEKLETFTVNLNSENGEGVLQIDLSVKVADEKVQEKVKQRAPSIRNEFIMILSSQHKEQLATLEGKVKLQEALMAKINKIIDEEDPEEGVSEVLITNFIIQ